MRPSQRAPLRPESVPEPVRVLVTGAGGPAAVSFSRAVAAAGHDCFMVDVDPCAAGLYLVPADHRALVPRGDDDSFADVLFDRCRSWGIGVLVPTVDVELLPVARRRHVFEQAGVALVVATVRTLECCLDKWRLLQACRDLPVPVSVLLDDGLERTELTWPRVAKPRRGSGSRGIRLLEGPADLDGLPSDGSYILQEMLPGEEYSVDVLAYRNGHVAAVVPRSRLKVDSGIAVAGRTVDDGDLVSAARGVAEMVGLSTVGNIQFRRDRAGVAKLLEVNPRVAGTMPLTVASGVDMPVLVVADALGRPVPDQVSYRPLAMVRHWSEVFLEADQLTRLGSPAPLGLPGGD